jgi:hypothetical protein
MISRKIRKGIKPYGLNSYLERLPGAGLSRVGLGDSRSGSDDSWATTGRKREKERPSQLGQWLEIGPKVN